MYEDNCRLATHLVGQRGVGSSLELVLVLGDECRVDLDLGGSKGWRGDELERLVAAYQRDALRDNGLPNLPDELSGEPEEWLLKVVL